MLSCSKKAPNNIDPQSGKDYLHAVSVYTDIFRQLQIGILSLQNKNTFSFDTLCMHIRMPSADTVFPKKLQIFYDSANACSIDGITRRGKITALISGNFKTQGTTATIIFYNYHMNTDSVNGILTLTSSGRNSLNQLLFTMTITNGIIFSSDKNLIIFNGTQTYTWTSGESSKNLTSNIYIMSENSNVINIDDETFSVTTTNPLTIAFNCSFRIVSGMARITPAKRDMLTLDFGSTETCSGKAILNTDNLTPINLTFN